MIRIMSKKKNENIDKGSIEKDIQEFEIHINEFGEIIRNLEIERINQFLNKNVEDKKLKNRPEKNNFKHYVTLLNKR